MGTSRHVGNVAGTFLGLGLFMIGRVTVDFVVAVLLVATWLMVGYVIQKKGTVFNPAVDIFISQFAGVFGVFNLLYWWVILSRQMSCLV